MANKHNIKYEIKYLEHNKIFIGGKDKDSEVRDPVNLSLDIKEQRRQLSDQVTGEDTAKIKFFTRQHGEDKYYETGLSPENEKKLQATGMLLDPVRPNTIESMFVLDTTEKNYNIEYFYDDDIIIPKALEIKKKNKGLYWSGITMDGLYFFKHDTTTLWSDYQPLDIKLTSIKITDGKLKNNISKFLDIKPSAYSPLHIMYKIWDLIGIKKANFFISPEQWGRMYFDRTREHPVSKFFNVSFKQEKTDGEWGQQFKKEVSISDKDIKDKEKKDEKDAESSKSDKKEEDVSSKSDEKEK